MSELLNELSSMDVNASIQKSDFVTTVGKYIADNGYTVVELNDEKPWGAYFRFDNDNANAFIAEFFPGLTPIEARLGRDDLELSPKILIVSPGQRLSWQYHNRRAERWAFLTDGAYNKSMNNDEGELFSARAGDVIQFDKSERHRLVGQSNTYALVAEIWQHTDPSEPSNEDDIIRLQDDYKRD